MTDRHHRHPQDHRPHLYLPERGGGPPKKPIGKWLGVGFALLLAYAWGHSDGQPGTSSAAASNVSGSDYAASSPTATPDDAGSTNLAGPADTADQALAAP